MCGNCKNYEDSNKQEFQIRYGIEQNNDQVGTKKKRRDFDASEDSDAESLPDLKIQRNLAKQRKDRIQYEKELKMQEEIASREKDGC